MNAYDCQPVTAWMLGTLIPIAILFLIYNHMIEKWSWRRYPRLVDDSNRRKLFEGGMFFLGLFTSLMLWGFVYEAICRV